MNGENIDASLWDVLIVVFCGNADSDALVTVMMVCSSCILL